MGTAEADRVDAAAAAPLQLVRAAAALRWTRPDLTATLAELAIDAAPDPSTWMAAAGWLLHGRATVGDGRETACRLLDGFDRWGDAGVELVTGPAGLRFRSELAGSALRIGEHDIARLLLAADEGDVGDLELRADVLTELARRAVGSTPERATDALSAAEQAWEAAGSAEGAASVMLLAASRERRSGRVRAAAEIAAGGLDRLNTGARRAGTKGSDHLAASLTAERINALVEANQVEQARSDALAEANRLIAAARTSRQVAGLRLAVARLAALEEGPDVVLGALEPAAQDAADSDVPALEAVCRSMLGELHESAGRLDAALAAVRSAMTAERRAHDRDAQLQARLRGAAWIARSSSPGPAACRSPAAGAQGGALGDGGIDALAAGHAGALAGHGRPVERAGDADARAAHAGTGDRRLVSWDDAWAEGWADAAGTGSGRDDSRRPDLGLGDESGRVAHTAGHVAGRPNGPRVGRRARRLAAEAAADGAWTDIDDADGSAVDGAGGDRGWAAAGMARSWADAGTARGRLGTGADRGWSDAAAADRGWSEAAGADRGWSVAAAADRGWSEAAGADRGWSVAPDADRGWPDAADAERGRAGSIAATRGWSGTAGTDRERSGIGSGELADALDGRRATRPAGHHWPDERLPATARFVPSGGRSDPPADSWGGMGGTLIGDALLRELAAGARPGDDEPLSPGNSRVGSGADGTEPDAWLRSAPGGVAPPLATSPGEPPGRLDRHDHNEGSRALDGPSFREQNGSSAVDSHTLWRDGSSERTEQPLHSSVRDTAVLHLGIAPAHRPCSATASSPGPTERSDEGREPRRPGSWPDRAGDPESGAPSGQADSDLDAGSGGSEGVGHRSPFVAGDTVRYDRFAGLGRHDHSTSTADAVEIGRPGGFTTADGARGPAVDGNGDGNATRRASGLTGAGRRGVGGPDAVGGDAGRGASRGIAFNAGRDMSREAGGRDPAREAAERSGGADAEPEVDGRSEVDGRTEVDGRSAPVSTDAGAIDGAPGTSAAGITRPGRPGSAGGRGAGRPRSTDADGLGIADLLAGALAEYRGM